MAPPRAPPGKVGGWGEAAAALFFWGRFDDGDTSAFSFFFYGDSLKKPATPPPKHNAHNAGCRNILQAPAVVARRGRGLHGSARARTALAVFPRRVAPRRPRRRVRRVRRGGSFGKWCAWRGNALVFQGKLRWAGPHAAMTRRRARRPRRSRGCRVALGRKKRTHVRLFFSLSNPFHPPPQHRPPPPKPATPPPSSPSSNCAPPPKSGAPRWRRKKPRPRRSAPAASSRRACRPSTAGAE